MIDNVLQISREQIEKAIAILNPCMNDYIYVYDLIDDYYVISEHAVERFILPEDKFYDVLEEVPRVRKDLGECPLVTPSSQIVGTQAVLNVVMGERYKTLTKEAKDMLVGKYGRTTVPVNAEIQKKALDSLGMKEPITYRPADDLEPSLAKFEKEMAQYKQQDEDVLSYALFPQVATEFFKYREAQQTGVDVTAANTENKTYPV